MPNWPNWQQAVQYSQDGPGVTLLHRSERLKVLLVGLEPGQALPPHPGPEASFSFLGGRGIMLIGDEEIEVGAGSFAVVSEGEARSVRATTERLAFVGTLGDPDATHG